MWNDKCFCCWNNNNCKAYLTGGIVAAFEVGENYCDEQVNPSCHLFNFVHITQTVCTEMKVPLC